MTGQQQTPKRTAAPAAGPSASTLPEAPWWLLRHRVTVPEQTPGFFERPTLAARAAPTARRLTLLLAPGGFGKTTLLAEGCRAAAARGIPTAWLSLDDDEPGVLDTYLAFALQHAGIDFGPALRTPGPDAEPPYPRTTLLLRALEFLDTPCVLALDEAERVTRPDSAALLDFLVRAAPAHLHLAIAGRELPAGLDVADPTLAGGAELVTAAHLRFTRSDIAGFFGARLSRAQLDAMFAASAGWPVALRFERDARPPEQTGTAQVARHVIDNWIEARIWTTLAAADRDFLLDVGQFQWFDAPLLDDVLDAPGAMTRLTRIQPLDGLLGPARAAAGVVSLHPLLRDHCTRTLKRDDPPRYRDVHRRIARALARRDHTVDALRHATEAHDAALGATLLLDAGGLRLGLREGFDRLAAAVHLLPSAALAREGRLALAQCAADAAAGRIAAARGVLARIPRASPAEVTGADLELSADRCLARVIVANFACESALTEEERRDLHDDMRYLAGAPGIDPLVGATIDFTLSVGGNLHAAFERGREHRERLLSRSHASGFLTASTHVHAGQAAMAQGRVADAEAAFARGRELAERRFLQDPGLTLATNVLSRELQLERDHLDDTRRARPPNDTHTRLALDAYFAAADIAVEVARVRLGEQAALEALDDARERALRNDLASVGRHLAAARVDLLARIGRVDEAQHTWQTARLPDSDAACTTVIAQSWREAESISCARIRLLAAAGDRGAARRLAKALIAASTERGLRRTVMRAHALCLSVEHEAGDDSAAQAHLAEFLALYLETDYARPLVRERHAEAVLSRFLDTEPDGIPSRAARRLLAGTHRGERVSRLTTRQTDILRLLEVDRDDDIAAELGLTRSGIRYHVGSLFEKLGVRSRRDAVQRARELGLLPPRP